MDTLLWLNKVTGLLLSFLERIPAAPRACGVDELLEAQAKRWRAGQQREVAQTEVGKHRVGDDRRVRATSRMLALGPLCQRGAVRPALKNIGFGRNSVDFAPAVVNRLLF